MTKESWLATWEHEALRTTSAVNTRYRNEARCTSRTKELRELVDGWGRSYRGLIHESRQRSRRRVPSTWRQLIPIPLQAGARAIGRLDGSLPAGAAAPSPARSAATNRWPDLYQGMRKDAKPVGLSRRHRLAVARCTHFDDRALTPVEHPDDRTEIGNALYARMSRKCLSGTCVSQRTMVRNGASRYLLIS